MKVAWISIADNGRLMFDFKFAPAVSAVLNAS
jgi:hypothetical protein